MEKSQELGALLERGLQLFGLGQQAEAISLWRQVLELDPNNGRAHEYLRFVQDEGHAASQMGAAGAAVEQNQSTTGALSASGAAPAQASAPAKQASSFLGNQSWGDLIASGPQVVSPAPVIAPVNKVQADAEGSVQERVQSPVIEPAQAPLIAVSDKPASSGENTIDGSFDSGGQQFQGLGSGALLGSVSQAEQAVTPSSTPAVAAVAQAEALAAASGDASAAESAPEGGDDQAGDDPWEEGDSVTETVTLAAEDEFLEPLSGEFSIEEHPDDPGTNPEMLMAPEFAANASAPSDVEDDCKNLMQGAIDMFALGDFSGSLDLVEQVLKLDPDNAAAKDYLERNQDTLLQMYESKIGSFSEIPRVCIPPDEVIWLNLHHRAGFLLSQIDGTVSYDDIMSLSGMSQLETCKILVSLIRDGVIQS